jgi:DedD protein
MLTSRSGSAGQSAPQPPQTIEAVRRRARHRLIGAAVLVLVGVLGFPLLFDTQPRPIAVDIPIEIPSRGTAAPVRAEPATATKTEPVATANSLGAREEVVETRPAPEKPAPKAAEATAAKPAEKPVQKPADKPAEKVADKPAEKVAEKAAEKPAEKPADKAGGNERIVVQVGAFADAQRAREARLKLERAGLKTYTHVAETPEGKRIRVRLGPFASKAEADKAAERAKAVGLPASLLWL